MLSDSVTALNEQIRKLQADTCYLYKEAKLHSDYADLLKSKADRLVGELNTLQRKLCQ